MKHNATQRTKKLDLMVSRCQSTLLIRSFPRREIRFESLQLTLCLDTYISSEISLPRCKRVKGYIDTARTLARSRRVCLSADLIFDTPGGAPSFCFAWLLLFL